MLGVRQIAAVDWCVISRQRRAGRPTMRSRPRTKEAFLDLISSRLADIYLDGLSTECVLQLPDSLLRGFELRDCQHILIGRYCDASTDGNSPLRVLKQ